MHGVFCICTEWLLLYKTFQAIDCQICISGLHTAVRHLLWKLDNIINIGISAIFPAYEDRTCVIDTEACDKLCKVAAIFFFPVCFPDSSVQRNKGFFITFLKLTPSLKQLFELQPSGVCRSIARPGKKEGRERQMGGAASDQVDQVVMWTEDLKCRSGGVQCCSETELQVTWSNVYRCGWACSVCTLCEARQTNCSTHIQATAKMRSSWLCVLISSFLFLCCCFFQFQAENNPSPRCLEVGTWIAPAGWPYR